MPDVLWAHTADPATKVDLTGYAGLLRYLGTVAGAHSGLTPAEVDYVHGRGLGLGLIWQDGKGSAGLGAARGTADVARAETEADNLGAPRTVPVFYTVDDNLSVAQVEPYFRAVMAAATRPVGIYASRALCVWAASIGIPYRFQTKAWSGGVISDVAHLYHRDGNVPSGASLIDIDVRLRAFPAWTPGDRTMAAPPTPAQLEDAGRRAAAAAGVAFVVYPGAAGRCRCCSGAHNPTGPKIRTWGPFIGVIRHITAGGLGSRTMETYCRDILINDPSVPFKCQFSTAPNGDIWWLGSGRANHDLNMSQAAYDALTHGAMSLTEFCQNLRGSALVGSVYTIGIEQVAATAPTAVQANATDHLVAELCRIPGWSGVDMAGHGEVASDRGPGDPNEHMGNARQRTRGIVSGVTPPTQEIDMTPQEFHDALVPIVYQDIKPATHEALVDVLYSDDYKTVLRTTVTDPIVDAINRLTDALKAKP